MGQLAAYGQEFAKNFGLEDAPSIVTRILRKSKIAVTEVLSDRPRVGMTEELKREEAWLVGLQLRDFPHSRMWLEGRELDCFDLRAGETLFYDLTRDPRVLIDQPFHSVHFYIPRATFDAVADDVSAPRVSELDYPPGAGVRDATILGLGQSLLAAFAHPEQASRLFVDHVTLAVATHVAQAYGGLRPNTRAVRGGLAPWQLRRTKELLCARLDGSVTVKELAEECGLSVSHFSRAFRASAGMAPHAWLTQRRIEESKQLLARTANSLLQIALACGFADQSHFTHVFTRHAGVSPGQWRRGL